MAGAAAAADPDEIKRALVAKLGMTLGRTAA
jgi:hypothetical protein